MTRITSRLAALLVLLTSLAAFFVAAPAAPAAAQTCNDPYGCPGTTTTTTTTPGNPESSCIVSTRVGIVGTTVDVTVTNVPIGLRVNLLLNGVQVDSAVAGATGDAVASLEGPTPKSARSVKAAAAPAQGTGLVDVTFAFRVPTGPPGSYTLVAVADGFQSDCFPFTILREVSAGNDNRNNGGGSLARTGFTVLGLLILAAILLLLGRAMVEASRRRRPTAS